MADLWHRLLAWFDYLINEERWWKFCACAGALYAIIAFILFLTGDNRVAGTFFLLSGSVWFGQSLLSHDRVTPRR